MNDFLNIDICVKCYCENEMKRLSCSKGQERVFIEKHTEYIKELWKRDKMKCPHISYIVPYDYAVEKCPYVLEHTLMKEL